MNQQLASSKLICLLSRLNEPDGLSEITGQAVNDIVRQRKHVNHKYTVVLHDIAAGVFRRNESADHIRPSVVRPGEVQNNRNGGNDLKLLKSLQFLLKVIEKGILPARFL